MGIENIANAVLILGVLYLNLCHGLDYLLMGLLVIFGLALWTVYAFKEERKELLKSEIRLNNAKAEYYNNKALGVFKDAED